MAARIVYAIAKVILAGATAWSGLLCKEAMLTGGFSNDTNYGITPITQLHLFTLVRVSGHSGLGLDHCL